MAIPIGPIIWSLRNSVKHAEDDVVVLDREFADEILEFLTQLEDYNEDQEHKVTIEFPNQKIKDEFIGWFLDGGGDQTFDNALELRDVEIPEGKFLNLSWTLLDNLIYTFKEEA